jgi:hypothetical protein
MDLEPPVAELMEALELLEQAAAALEDHASDWRRLATAIWSQLPSDVDERRAVLAYAHACRTRASERTLVAGIARHWAATVSEALSVARTRAVRETGLIPYLVAVAWAAESIARLLLATRESEALLVNDAHGTRD